jgi:predicted nucleotidyltransferase
MTLEQLRTTSREQIIRLALDCGASNVRVFGSVARGETDPRSDVDLLVDLEPGRSLLDLARLQRKLEELLTVRVDVVSARGLRDSVRETVFRDALPL